MIASTCHACGQPGVDRCRWQAAGILCATCWTGYMRILASVTRKDVQT